MNSESDNLPPERDTTLPQIRGGPRKPEIPGEETKWERFLKWFCPWLNQKRRLGERFLEAEVTIKEAEARNMQAQALKTAMEAAEIAKRIERKRIANEPACTQSRGNNATNYSADLDNALSELEGRLKELRLKYGTRILEVEVSGELDGVE